MRALDRDVQASARVHGRRGQGAARPDDQRVAVAAQRVERLRGRDADPAPLPGREPPGAVVAAELASRFVDDRAGRGREAVPLEEVAVVAACEEARLLALGASRGGKPCRLRLRTRLTLRPPAQREPEPVEEARIEPRGMAPLA